MSFLESVRDHSILRMRTLPSQNPKPLDMEDRSLALALKYHEAVDNRDSGTEIRAVNFCNTIEVQRIFILIFVDIATIQKSILQHHLR